MTVKELLIKILTKSDTKGTDDIQRGLKGANDQLDKTDTKAKKTSKSLAALKMGFKGLRMGVSGLLKVGREFVKWGGAAVLAVAGMVREFTVYNFQMGRAWTMMDTGVKGFIKMRREVARLSGDLGIVKSQLAGGLYDALSKGVPEDNVLEFLRTAGKAAVADGSDVKTMVNGLTNTMNAFKIPLKDVTKVADVMATIVKNGGTNFQELASYLSVVAPIAAATGLKFEQIGAAVATITKQGTPTAVAMTQIRAAIIGLNQVLGDGWSKTMTFQEAVGKVVDKAGGSQVALQKMVGSVEAVSAILALTGKNAKMADADLRAMGDSAGNLEAAFQKMDQLRHWPKLWETVRGLVTRIGEVFDNTLKPVAIAITAQIAKWRDADKIWDGLDKKLIAMREAAWDIFEALRGGGSQAAGELWAGIKDIFIGALQRGGELARDVLVEAAPKVGELMGTAAKQAMTSGGRILQKAETAAEAARAGEISKGQGALYSMTFGLFGSKATKAAVSKRLKDKRAAEIASVYSEDAAPGESAGLARMNRGWGSIRNLMGKGRALRGQTRAAAGMTQPEIEEENRMERARQILQQRLQAEQGDVTRTQGIISQSGRRPGSAAQTILAREKGDVRRVEAAMADLAAGDEKIADAILAWAARMKDQKETLAKQIRNLPL